MGEKEVCLNTMGETMTCLNTMGETEICLNFDGKTPLGNDRFARWAIRSEKKAGHDLYVKEL